MKFLSYLLISILVGLGCNDAGIATPKPRMYPRVVFPLRNTVDLEKSYCNFTFEYPDYFEFHQDTNFFEEKPLHPCWFNLNSKALNTTLHCSYYPIKSKKDFDKHIQDAFEMAGKHNIKANYRKEALIEGNNKVHGLMFEIEGPVASPLQFYLTDSTSNFFRASLYFDAKVNPDSTKVVYDFILKDINHIIETFRWN